MTKPVPRDAATDEEAPRRAFPEHEMVRLIAMSANTEPAWCWIGPVSVSTRTPALEPALWEYRTRQAEGSTSIAQDVRAIEEGVRSLLESASPEEDGVDTPLISWLLWLTRTLGVDFVLELAGLIESGTVDPQIASWMLRWLGRVPHDESRHIRRWLLERGLKSRDPLVRDGAALGLASLGDPRTAPALRAAVELEPYRGLRRNIEQALHRVERTA